MNEERGIILTDWCVCMCVHDYQQITVTLHIDPDDGDRASLRMNPNFDMDDCTI
jgi:hypothetical protein